MQLVYELFAPDLPPLLDAIRSTIGDVECRATFRQTGSDSWHPAPDELPSLVARLQQHEIDAFALHPHSGLIRYTLVIELSRDSLDPARYFGTIEYTGNRYESIWNVLLGIQDLHAACLGFEEGVEVGRARLTPEAFPWEEWPLVRPLC